MDQSLSIEELLNSITVNQTESHLAHVVKELQKLDYDGLQTNSVGETPLTYAVIQGYTDVVGSIINIYKDIDITDNIFSKPLHINQTVGGSLFDDSKTDNSRLIKIINQQDDDGKSLLLHAIEQEYFAVACTLVLHGANVDAIPKEAQEKLLQFAAGETHAAYSREHEYRPVVGLLAIKVPEAVSDYSEDYEYPRLLSYYLLHCHLKVVNALLSVLDYETRTYILNNADNHCCPFDRINASYIQFTDDDHLKAVKYLLDNEAWKTSNNFCYIKLTLQSAAQKGHIKTFKYLLNQTDKADFNTYIGLATIESRMNIVEFLWNNHRSSTTDTSGNTALHYAAWKGSLTSVKYLCENGARKYLKIKNSRGETPLQLALQRCQDDIITYLVSLVQGGPDFNQMI